MAPAKKPTSSARSRGRGNPVLCRGLDLRFRGHERDKWMPIEIFLLILFAAMVHAAWNALVKAEPDRLTLWRVILATQFVLSVCLLPFVPVPAPAAWPYLVGSAVTNIGYVLFLTQAYRFGDLSHAYPLARG